MKYYDAEGALIRVDKKTNAYIYRTSGVWERYGDSNYLLGDSLTESRAKEMMAEIDGDNAKSVKASAKTA